MPCNDCPELIPSPNEGCLQPITSECVTYNGEDVICATITSGQNLNQVIEQLATNDCDLQEQIEDVISSLETFTCEDLSGCSINNLADVDVTPVSGESLVFNGTNWISQTIVLPNEFNCSDLAGCSLNNLGNVVESSPTNGEVLVFNGTNWVNQTIVLPNEFSCESLSGCSLDDFSNVIETSSASGDVLIFNGTNWVNVEYDLLLTANNGLTKSSSNIELGGTLIKNTSILGANFDLVLGTNASSIDKLNAYTDSVNIRSTLFSFNESDESTQTKGFRFETNKTSIAIGTDVFNDFNINDVFRIGSNITISDTIILPGFTTRGIFIGKNINTTDSGTGPFGFGVVLGDDIILERFTGLAIGKNISATNGAGGIFMGKDIDYTGGGLGDQSLFAFGSFITVNHNFNVNEGNLVFNPTSAPIRSSINGSANNNDKIRVGDNNKIWTTFNSSGYYFFTDQSDIDGWSTSNKVCKIMPNCMRIPESNGLNVLEQEEGCIRYNPVDKKFQGLTNVGWVNFH